MNSIINKALNEATNSTDFRDRVGAVILNKKGHVISRGYNKRKTHPLQKRYANSINHHCIFLHAEMAAIVRMREQGHTIVVARKTKSGRIGMAKPCPICAIAIHEAGIKKVIYTTDSGKIIKEHIVR